MQFIGRSLTGLLLVATTLGLLAFAAVLLRDAMAERAAGNDRPRAAGERVFSVDVVTVVPRSVAPVLATYGEVVSRTALELRAASSGTIAALGAGVEEGGVVRAGQLLFRIDPVEAETALAVARADLRDGEAELRDAERALELAGDDLASVRAQAALQARALDRQRDLARRGVGTAAAIEAAELSAAAADQAVLSRRQSLAQAEARIDRAGTDLDRRRIALAVSERDLADTERFAPFDGVLTDIAVGRGTRVVANERLATLIDPDALEIAFRVSTAQYARLLRDGVLARTALRVSLDVDGYEIATTGRIDREAAVVGEGRTGRLLFARLDDAAGFRPGDFATVAAEEPALQDVAVLPAAAVDGTGGVLALAPLDAGGDVEEGGAEARLVAAQVAVLRRQGDDVIVAPGDLTGRKVVAARAPQLGAGIAVRITRRDGSADAPAADTAPAMLDLDDDRRARLVAFVEGSDAMPDAAKQRVLAQLRAGPVPAATVARLERRMGG